MIILYTLFKVLVGAASFAAGIWLCIGIGWLVDRLGLSMNVQHSMVNGKRVASKMSLFGCGIIALMLLAIVVMACWLAGDGITILINEPHQ